MSLNDPNFMNFLPVVLDDLDIYAPELLSSKQAYLSKYVKYSSLACYRQTKGSSGYHVPDDLSAGY